MKNTLWEEIQKTKQIKEYAKNMFCISIILFIIQIFFVIFSGRYYGDTFDKLKQFYFDETIYLKARTIPVFVLINCFGYIYNTVKLRTLSDKKSAEDEKNL